MRVLVIATIAGAVCAGCNGVAWNSDILNGTTGGGIFSRPSSPSPAPAPEPTEPFDATDGAVFDPTRGAEPPAQAVPGAVGTTGTTVASLGDPGIPGLWMETSLVSQAGSGRVRTASGATLVLTLKPLPGDGGSRLSIEAMRALGVPLTELVELTVQPLG